MNILICVKQVPCVEKMKYDELTQTVLRQKDDLMLNPFDASTIEQALTLKQKYPSVHFTIMSMGTMHAKAMLKELLAYDIDRAVLLSDPVFAGSDTLATGYVLSKGIRCAGDYDLIFCGKQSTDGDTGQVGPSLAQKLGIPHLTNVIEIEENTEQYMVCSRKTHFGCDRIRVQYPALISFDKNNQMLRSPTLRGILQAQQKQVEVWGADDIAAQREKCGRAGSPTRIIRSFIPKTDFKAVEIVGKPIQQASTLVNELGSVYSDLVRKAID